MIKINLSDAINVLTSSVLPRAYYRLYPENAFICSTLNLKSDKYKVALSVKPDLETYRIKENKLLLSYV